jgi:phenylalanyl-tRNA synthetase beta chain
MPKIEVNENMFFSLLGRRYDARGLEEMFPGAKAELDEWEADQHCPQDERVIKVELNDTNRPDLWSTAGLARALRVRASGKPVDYLFFSRDGEAKVAKRTVVVEPSVKEARPYLAGFFVSGKAITEAQLKDIIQTQEKLASNFGRKRRTVSMGVYRTGIVQWPVHYSGVDPDSVRFVPLQGERPMTLTEINKETPKGKEYGAINAPFKLHPLLSDSKGAVLSYPPVINSNDLGAVKVGDTELFIELTGTNMASVALSANIVACDFADSGYTIESVLVEYPYDTPFGRSVTFPYYFQKPVSVEIGYASKLLGVSLTVDAVREAAERMGSTTDSHGQYVTVFPPPYRNDFLHPVDIVEDVMMGKGMAAFSPERPKDFTIGRLSPIELLSRRAKNILAGLGAQEMAYGYLGSGKDFIERMGTDPAQAVRIENPMAESFEYVRPSILPSLMNSESVSSRAPYPHRIYEAGKVAFIDPTQNYGVSTRQRLAFLLSHASADYNEAASYVATLLYFLGKDYAIAEAEDPRFIVGRQARIIYKGEPIGIFGELHPRVLEAWSVTMPCSAAEIDLEYLL